MKTDEATANTWIDEPLEVLNINLSNLNEINGGTMSEITLNPDQLKEILKSAIVELIRDNRQEVSEFMAEIIEDVAMERAIASGETTELTSRESIFQLLEPKA